MTTTLSIVHTTGYRYSGTVTDSFNEIRMAPAYSPEQLIRQRSVSIGPHPWSYDFIDYWGTQVTAFELHEPHQEMTVRVTTSLDVTRKPPSGSDMTIAEAAADADRWNEYLMIDPLVEAPIELVDIAETIAANSSSIDHCALQLGARLHDELVYETGSTDVTSTAAHAWGARKGVCQDFAHLMIGALRHLGIPARYVSGYVMPHRGAEVGETVIGESHAWVQWWDGAWYSYDPTNAAVPGELHVQVGLGRDYDDVPPLRGLFMGQCASEMFVEVKMTRLA